MTRFFLFSGAILAASGVALGALGAHALKSVLTEPMLDAWKTGVLYQLFHALGLLIIGLLLQLHPESRGLVWAGSLLLIGCLCFSGSIYGLATTDLRWLGPVTPLGGLLMIGGWIGLAVSAWRLFPPGGGS